MLIKNAEYVTSCVSSATYPNVDEPEFIFLGRSNVGKSSLINTITNRKKLAYTSSKPGKTLTLNFYHINNNFYLIDFPGYGYAARSINQRLDFGKMIEDYLKKSNNLKCIFLVVDSRHEPTEDDKLMYDFLMHYNFVVYVVATKIDKLSTNEINKNVNIISNKLDVDKDKIITFSSLNKINVNLIHDVIESYLNN